MKAEDVPEEWVAEAANVMRDYRTRRIKTSLGGKGGDALERVSRRHEAAALLAAVAPLIAKAERERILALTPAATSSKAETVDWIRGADAGLAAYTAAIRALPDGEVGG